MVRLISKIGFVPKQWRIFIRPMLFISIGLHILLLSASIPENKPILAEKKKNDTKPIKITQLSRVKPPPKPSPKPVVKRVKPKLNVSIVRPKPLVSQIFKKATQPPSADSNSASKASKDSKANEASPSPKPEPTPQASKSPTPTIDPITQEFAAPLADLFNEVDAPGGEGKTTKEFLWKQEIQASPYDFQSPEYFFEDIETEKGKPGVLTYIYLSPVREDPESFFTSKIEALYTSNSFVTSKVGTYANGPVYEIKKAEDSRYFNIVLGGNKSPGGDSFQQTGLLVVIWKQAPI